MLFYAIYNIKCPVVKITYYKLRFYFRWCLKLYWVALFTFDCLRTDLWKRAHIKAPNATVPWRKQFFPWWHSPTPDNRDDSLSICKCCPRPVNISRTECIFKLHQSQQRLHELFQERFCTAESIWSLQAPEMQLASASKCAWDSFRAELCRKVFFAWVR